MLFSEPKIPQTAFVRSINGPRPGFSALQRAENSSKPSAGMIRTGNSAAFQCSSASRKFLKRPSACAGRRAVSCFSALQRAENSSKLVLALTVQHAADVSVLFSEPKIPQTVTDIIELLAGLGFSALQRAENSSNRPVAPHDVRRPGVSVLFSEPKIPQTCSSWWQF